MPLPTQFPVIFSGFATGYCWPSDPATFAGDLAQRLSVQWNVSGVTGVLVQTSTPTSSQRNFAWYNPDTGRTLYWNSGVSSWVSTHPSTPSGFERRLWEGTLLDLETYDGGSSGAVGDAAGPMWEVDSNWTGRVPLGVGLVPSSDPAVTTAVGDNVGEGSHVQTVAELAEHSHVVNLPSGGNDGSTYVWTAITNNNFTIPVTSETAGSSSPMSLLQPSRAVYVIKRSARIYYIS